MKMNVSPLSAALILLLSVGAASAGPSTATKTTQLPVVSNPSQSSNRPYKTFEPYELGLLLPQQIRPNTSYSSVTFYAVVLKVAPVGSEPSCDRGEFSSAWENERKRVQMLFPKQKVFADNQCPDMAAVSYTMSAKPNTRPFIAIYAGSTSKAAQPILAKVKAKYRSAQIKPMQVAFEQIIQ